ncbi:MAG: tetratricopeptide repeat protein [Balneolales bacterium]
MNLRFSLLLSVQIFYLIIVVVACSTIEPATGPESSSTTDKQIENSASSDDVIRARSHFIQGITAMKLDDPEAAEQHLLRAYKTLHHSSGVNQALAELYFQTKDYSSGLYYGHKAVELEPENKWYRLMLVDGYRAMGDHNKAIHQIDSILVFNPADVEVLYLKASIQTSLGNYQQSNETYQRILDLTGPDRSIYYQRISNFSRLENNDAIINELNKLLKLDEGNINTLLMLSQFYMEQGQTDKARDVLEKALKRNPRHPETLVNLTDIYIDRDEWEKAGELLQNLVGDTLVPTDNRLEIVQYIISRYSNEPENDPLKSTAEKLIYTLLETSSENGLAHSMAAEFFIIAEEGEQSLQHLEKTTELMPENDAAWRKLVQTLYIEGYYDKAIERGIKANEHVPEDAFIQFFLGGSYFLKEQYEHAVNWLRSASDAPSRSPFRSIILGTLGDAYSSLDRWYEAEDAYEEAIILDPDNDVILNNYAFHLSEREERLEQAKEMATRALELNPGNPAFLDTIGWIYFKMGDFDKAYEYIKASIDTGGASAEVMEHMGDVYDKLGKPDQALYWWQKALDEDTSRNHLKERLHIN